MGKMPTEPQTIPIPFAEHGVKNIIPETPISGTTNLASWDEGFPENTRQDKLDGGVPPSGKDFQGLFYTLSDHAFYKQSGSLYYWKADVNYPVNAVIAGSDGKIYRALLASGPDSSAGIKNPTSSSNSSYWQDIDKLLNTVENMTKKGTDKIATPTGTRTKTNFVLSDGTDISDIFLQANDVKLSTSGSGNFVSGISIDTNVEGKITITQSRATAMTEYCTYCKYCNYCTHDSNCNCNCYDSFDTWCGSDD